MVAVPLATLIIIKPTISRKKSVTAFLIVLLLPLILLANYMFHNYRDYGQVLPWNDTLINTSVVHSHDADSVNFVSFTPWQYINEPLVMPGQMHSFWTLIYCGMWVDTEPKFTFFTDKNDVWWKGYYEYLQGHSAFPSPPIPISNFTRIISAALLVAGIVPLVLIAIGFFRGTLTTVSMATRETVKLQMFPIMLFFNAVGIIFLVLKAPVYSSMKASYFLNSLPALAVFIAIGIQSIEKNIRIKRCVTIACCAIIFLASLYVIRIILCLGTFHGNV